ncbi:hypothetical protein I545_6982 [Mycobacterium kansasii 662]|uniref:Uncharacterized protein n=1 Tax=Mycobacterium kansasii 662 TaxID=1299326 RepID=X7XNC9_MYCKA|nr:hypothetical protein I545_6982 [Mycobacterium kansasii 662]
MARGRRRGQPKPLADVTAARWISIPGLQYKAIGNGRAG